MVIRDFERDLSERAVEILRASSERLSAVGFSWCEPEIRVKESDPEYHESWITVRFQGDESVEYFTELIIYECRPKYTIEEILQRLEEQLKCVGESRKWRVLNDLLLENFPGLREVYEDRLSEWCKPDETPGPYLVYEDVFWPHLANLLRENNEVELKKAFELTEALVAHEEEYFQGVAVIAILERVCVDDELLRLAQPYLGPVSRETAAEFEEFFDYWARRRLQGGG